MRFVGQAFEVGVEIPADRIAALDATYIAELFADAHHRTFMHGATLDRPVEIVTLRVGATLPIGAAPQARPRDAGARAGEDPHLPRRRLDRLRPPHRRGAEAGPEDRRPVGDRRLHGDDLGAARLDGDPRCVGQSDPAENGMRHAQPDRLRRDQPGADRRRPRDGREADPLGLLDHPARGARRLGRPDGPQRQHRGAGRADPDAAGADRRDPARLPQAPSGRHAQGRRLPDQQRPVRGRPAHPRRLHLHADLRRRPRRRLRRVGRASPRSRRRRARPQHPRLGRLPGRHPLSAQPVQLPPRLERRQLRAAGHRQRARARPHHRRLQRAVRRQRDRRAAGQAALRALRRRQGRSGDEGDAGLLRAPRAGGDRSRRPRALSMARMRSTTTASATIRW